MAKGDAAPFALFRAMVATRVSALGLSTQAVGLENPRTPDSTSSYGTVTTARS